LHPGRRRRRGHRVFLDDGGIKCRRAHRPRHAGPHWPVCTGMTGERVRVTSIGSAARART
jgi:hypothetical protein